MSSLGKRLKRKKFEVNIFSNWKRPVFIELQGRPNTVAGVFIIIVIFQLHWAMKPLGAGELRVNNWNCFSVAQIKRLRQRRQKKRVRVRVRDQVRDLMLDLAPARDLVRATRHPRNQLFTKPQDRELIKRSLGAGAGEKDQRFPKDPV